MLIKSLKVYLDTSIFNFAVTTQPILDKKEVTLKLLEKIKAGKFLGYISEVTFDEILEAGEKKRQDLLTLIDQMDLEELAITDEVDILADHYIESKIIPAKERDDALHIAVAVIHNLDVIVSWNFEHMVKLRTRREIPATNILLGYKNIEICSPLEMIEP